MGSISFSSLSVIRVAPDNNLITNWQIAYNYLKTGIGSWYSASFENFMRENDMTRDELNDITYPNGKYVELFKKKFNNDWINVFTFNNRTYVGLESRRIDYEKDKNNGINHVEQKIKTGYYK